MARSIILSSFVILECFAGRLFKKSVHESDVVPGQLLPLTQPALMPRVAAAHMHGPTRIEPLRTLHGGVGRRAPVVSMQDVEYRPDLAEDWKEKNKGEKTLLRPGGVGLTSGAAVLPHPRKADKTYDMFPYGGGEDSYFIDDIAGVVGVADGIGATSKRGVDSGIYSRQLMQFAAEEVRSDVSQGLQDDPVGILDRAYTRTLVGGASTALILAVSEAQVGASNWKVRVANMGDSGLVQVRKGEILFQSTPLVHAFNLPYQLSGDIAADSPFDAQSFEIEDVQKGDVFVVGTDGLWDNAFGEEVATIVSREKTKAMTTQLWAQNSAREIALWALQGADKKPGRATPWGASKDLLGYNFVGGKLDDITVVMVVVDAPWSNFGA